MSSINTPTLINLCKILDDRFSMPCVSTIKKIGFTIDLWTQFHIPYIGITIHWLTSDFELRQGLLTIEKFPYGHSGEISDNAMNMTAALQQFNINYYAHTLQLAINEGLEECREIINKAKILDNALVCRDKYRETLRRVQQLIVNNNVQSNSKILEPIRDVPTRWNSTYAVL
ncbi:5039_t:CDS:2 [Ambispora gerdemannii]|uniref:5039_t:CDS:1 n=1 Tax=Ambispora gerdemannii TaxID=144530 RepID=A0A9N9BKW8_9GLOM|nr:5039_t:CDS:2 [Ambispora gerdemannii]